MNFQKPKALLYAKLSIAIIPLLLVFILRLLGFDGLYGQDSYEYLRYTIAIQEYITTGAHPGPFYWPVLYPTLGSLFGLLFRDTAFALQFLSCISFSMASIYLLKTIRLLYSNAAFSVLYVLIFTVLSPFLLKMGLIVMSDITALLFIVLSFYFFFKSQYKKTSTAPVFIFATCALMTRYPSLFITFPIIIYSLYTTIKRQAVKPFLIGALVSFMACIPFLILQWDALFEASSNYFLKVWSVTNYFKSSYQTTDGTQFYQFPNLIYTLYIFFHPGFIFIGAILSVITLKNYKYGFTFNQKILGFCISLYILFLAGIPFQNSRILALVFPLTLIFMFPAFEKIINIKFIKKHLLILGLFAVTLQLLFWYITFNHIFNRSILEKEIVTMVKPYEGKTLYSFDLDLSLQGRGLNFEYKNMYLEVYKTYRSHDLILFNPDKYALQWQGKNPMLNWQFMEHNYKLKILQTHPDGWKLYQIEHALDTH
ncbi:ArnT family glycosyltransferase [Algibacter miyuki]|uniref:ArnT family glycosyltransferase n=1 Tax=Algibacter miyuki TaxID=1306933 RepID=A0ABV5GWW0_9FLAO|nr:glycosyltransferase family 39 protein [Algibacter miyuki]MDN3664291.1 glycosyltransferase family 39 protein [Algibacter miyuki]